MRLLAIGCCLLGALAIGSNEQEAAAQGVEVEVFQTATGNDDYIGWAPVPCRVRLAAAESADVNVVLENDAPNPAKAGELQFAAWQDPWPASTTATAASLPLTLPKNGDWVSFMLAGKPGNASTKDKDAHLIVRKAGTGAQPVLADHPLMVRVRKSAAELTVDERNRFLTALGQLHANGDYDKFQDMHQLTGIQGHGQAAFPAWHRAMLLQLERELQELDASVTIPYWKFKDPPKEIFSKKFMGANLVPGQPASLVVFEDLALGVPHPLEGAFPSLHRSSFNNFQTLPLPPLPNGAQSEGSVVAPFSYAAFQGRGTVGLPPNHPLQSVGLERRSHNTVHTFTGGTGPLGNPATAVRDPIFFLLHCNVDRIWAVWQDQHQRFDIAAANTYAPSGAFAGGMGQVAPFVFRGHFLNDTMWPWDGTMGDGGTPMDTLDDRPTWAAAAAFPTRDGFGPSAKPTPAEMIDYQGRLSRKHDLGFCYDDVNF